MKIKNTVFTLLRGMQGYTLLRVFQWNFTESILVVSHLDRNNKGFIARAGCIANHIANFLTVNLAFINSEGI